MMKKLAFILTLIFSLLLCACGSTDSAEAPVPTATIEPIPAPTPTPAPVAFAEENGFTFVETNEYNVPLKMQLVGAEGDIETFGTNIKINSISRSEADENGRVVYTVDIDYTQKFNISITNQSGSGFRMGSGYPTIDFYDYYTGQPIPSTAAVCELIPEAEELNPVTVEFDGWSAEIINTYTVSSSRFYLSDGQSNTLYTYSVSVPDDYDGLILGINPSYEFEIPEADSYFDYTKYFSGDWSKHNIADWEFIRVSEAVIQ